MFQVHHRSDVQGFPPPLNTRNFFRLRMIHIQKGFITSSRNNAKAFKSLRAKQKVITVPTNPEGVRHPQVGEWRSNSAGSTILNQRTFFFRFLHPGATQHDLTTIICM